MRMWRDLKPWLGIGLLGLIVLFTVQNVAIVELNFFFWSFRTPRAILVFLIFLAGVLAGWIVRGLRKSNRARRENS